MGDCARVFGRSPVAAGVIALLLAVSPLGVLANQNDRNDGNQQRDTQSRHEQPSLNTITLNTDDGVLTIRYVTVIQSRHVHIAETSSGVESDSLDRLDVGAVPLFGNLFERPLNADDFTRENRVGAVYDAGDGGLAVVVDDSVAVSGIKISVVNGKLSAEIRSPPRPIQAASVELGEFGTLRSVQTMMAGQASQDTSIVLGGLTRTSVPETSDKVPVLGDIPVLQRLFRGTAHRGRDDRLLILVKPTIIVGEEEF
ncbi:MAG: hypothetical protein ACFCUW_00805 [Kiloniellaceae bacterium]